MNTSKQNPSSDLKPSVIGVDLGSFSTKIAAVDKGAIDIITNQANLRQTPSIVGYGSKERLIGESGNVKLKSNLANTIISPQRYLCLQNEQELQHETRFLPCKIRRQEIENKFKVNCQGKEEMIAPQQATAALFTKIQQIIELNQIGSKAITVAVPIDFTHQQRQALIDSLQISRKASKDNFSLQIIGESTAVGLDYGYYKRNEFSEKDQQGKNVMFLDFGHSKLSLYIIKFTRNYQKVLYQKHLNQLGCRDLDEIVLKFYSDLFEKQNPNMEISVKESKKATFKLLQAIQKQRKVLTGISEYDFNIDCLLEECDISYTMKRQEFQNIISTALETLQTFFRGIISDLKEKSISFSSIQLIGGGTRIPIFIKTVSNIFGVDPSRTLNSSQCIAKGTALYSAMNCGIFRMHPYYSIDLSPQTIDINWKTHPQQFFDELNKVVLINEGEHIYSKKSVDLKVNSGKQNKIFFSLSNGRKGDICSFSIQLTCDNQQTIQRNLRLSSTFSSNGTIYKITIYELKETIQKQIQVHNFTFYQHINPEQMREFIKIEAEQIKKDKQIINFYESKNQFQSQIYDLKQKASGFIRNNQIKDYINPNDHNLLMSYFENLEDKLEQIVEFDGILKEVKQKMSCFYNFIQEAKKSYESADAQLQKFSQLIDSVISGKMKKVKYYPKQEAEEALQWIKDIKSLQKTKPKYQPHPASLQQINQRIQSFKASVDRIQQQMAIKQRESRQRYVQPERNSQPTRFYNQNQPYDPFGTSYQSRQYDPRYRRGRNQSFNGYNSGIFSGFSGFF